MDPLLAHRRLTAAAAAAAERITTLRHAHIGRTPMVICAYHLAGDPGAPLGLVYGDDPGAPRTIVIGEPRNRELRFHGLARLAADLNRYFDSYTSRSVVLDQHGRPKRARSGGTLRLADDAPQIVVPNAGTAEWLRLLARSTVWLRTDGEFAVDAALPRVGGHLTHITGRRAIAGSSSLVAATELLNLHWTTGQTDFEDANLATLLAWVDPEWMDPAWLPTGARVIDSVMSARYAETLPSGGPVPDPQWDAEVLEELVAAYNRARGNGRDVGLAASVLTEAVAAQLLPAWTAAWRAIAIVKAIPAAPTVPRRWENDRWSWTSHLNRVAADRAFFRRYRTATQSARALAASEESVAAWHADMAFDDPLVMARHVAAGTAVEGTVTRRDDEHSQLSPAGRRNRRPLIHVRCDDDVLVPGGTEVTWAADPRVRGVITEVPATAADELTIMVTAGMRTAALPSPGDHGIFATFGRPTRFPDNLPDGVPWTHVLPAADGVRGAA